MAPAGQVVRLRSPEQAGDAVQQAGHGRQRAITVQHDVQVEQVEIEAGEVQERDVAASLSSEPASTSDPVSKLVPVSGTSLRSGGAAEAKGANAKSIAWGRNHFST